LLGSTGSFFRLTRFSVLVLALLLAACGRKGPLDLPPAETQSGNAASSVSQPPQTSSSPQVEYNAEGRPLAPRGQKKKLPADILLD